MLWVHHEAEELRVHYRETIPEMTARHVVVDLLASGQVARMNPGWLVTRPPARGQRYRASGEPCVRTATLAASCTTRWGWFPGIDLRGDGGFVVAPPSVHPSGLHLLRERGYRPGHALARWRRLVKEGIQEGERNSSIASLAVHLFWHGIDPTVVLEPLAVLERAPLPAAAP